MDHFHKKYIIVILDNSGIVREISRLVLVNTSERNWLKYVSLISVSRGFIHSENWDLRLGCFNKHKENVLFLKKYSHKFQTWCDSWGCSVQGQDLDFKDPCGSLLTQDILWFSDSMMRFYSSWRKLMTLGMAHSAGAPNILIIRDISKSSLESIHK